mmetsp:Transcript_6173/g.17258  ORF Transcript_6173/g.17258 Transcript_6173/m.17258 type:complete len:105 (+) Transcript_6173:3-317(+)
MKKQGELDDASQLKRLMEIDINSEGGSSGTDEGSMLPRDETEAPPPSQVVAPPSPPPPPSAPVAKEQPSSSDDQSAKKKSTEKKLGSDEGGDASKENVRNILKF